LAAFFVSQASAQTDYYSNDFESASALDDGYWSLHDAQIQAVDSSNVLVVDGEASFMPEEGSYALDNFTVQFDVSHNMVYENNTGYQGPFYEAADSEGNVVFRVGYVERQIGETYGQVGFINFCAETTGETSHYYFPFDHSSEWATWRVTATITNRDGVYYGDVTVQINGEAVTAFTNDREQTLPNITNEPIVNPPAYHNLLPLPQAGVLQPTYAPTASSSDIHYSLLSNTKAVPLASGGATPSYIDNFCYGYADTVPLSSGSTPSTQPTINTGSEPGNSEPFPTALAVVVILLVIVVALVGVLAYLRKSKRA
jgi:hypothetical protein